MSGDTVLEQDGFAPVNVKIGNYVWLRQCGADGKPSVVVLDRDSARTLAEYLLAAIPPRQSRVVDRGPEEDRASPAGLGPFDASDAVAVAPAPDSDTWRQEVEALKAEIARLKRPDLFWVESEIGRKSDPNGMIAVIREGRRLGVTYYAVLPPADDADSDEDWQEEFTSRADAEAALAAEKARRAALAGTAP